MIFFSERDFENLFDTGLELKADSLRTELPDFLKKKMPFIISFFDQEKICPRWNVEGDKKICQRLKRKT